MGVHLGGRGEVPLPDANADLGHLQAGNAKKETLTVCATPFLPAAKPTGHRTVIHSFFFAYLSFLL